MVWVVQMRKLSELANPVLFMPMLSGWHGVSGMAAGVVNHAIAAHRRWSSICLAKNTGLCTSYSSLFPIMLNPYLPTSTFASPPMLWVAVRGVNDVGVV